MADRKPDWDDTQYQINIDGSSTLPKARVPLSNRVLPSREEVADRPDSNTHPDWDMWWEQVGNPTLDARASGRLVDRREAIDYEAFRREYFGTQVPNRDTEARIRRAFDAALGPV